mmetsp:Transcript_73566/g.168635  ORF Transcript_73566/g.168635 Transcript_73566/m.168635 type:complete len:399 (-) Transcript_73566:64-1260(-)
MCSVGETISLRHGGKDIVGTIVQLKGEGTKAQAVLDTGEAGHLWVPLRRGRFHVVRASSSDDSDSASGSGSSGAEDEGEDLARSMDSGSEASGDVSKEEHEEDESAEGSAAEEMPSNGKADHIESSTRKDGPFLTWEDRLLQRLREHCEARQEKIREDQLAKVASKLGRHPIAVRQRILQLQQQEAAALRKESTTTFSREEDAVLLAFGKHCQAQNWPRPSWPWSKVARKLECSEVKARKRWSKLSDGVEEPAEVRVAVPSRTKRLYMPKVNQLPSAAWDIVVSTEENGFVEQDSDNEWLEVERTQAVSSRAADDDAFSVKKREQEGDAAAEAQPPRKKRKAGAPAAGSEAAGLRKKKKAAQADNGAQEAGADTGGDSLRKKTKKGKKATGKKQKKAS